MTLLKRQQTTLRMLPADRIDENPHQPRVHFDEAALRTLAESIRENGILQPLIVTQGENGRYRLIAGERRLRAARIAGLAKVPCLLRDETEEQAALLALTENLQRQDLHFLEEADSIAELISAFGLSQEEAAKKLGLSQSAVANKLRLRRLSDDCRALLLSARLTERHARALLRLPDEKARYDALLHIAKKGLNVAESERYIDACLHAAPPRKSGRSPVLPMRDVRLFLNTVDKGLSLMRAAGFDPELRRLDGENDIFLTIRNKKRPMDRVVTDL